MTPGAHERIQRLVFVAKMATVFEACTTEEQRSVVRFMWAKWLNVKNTNKSFTFMLGSVCRVGWETWQTFSWWRRSWNGGAEVAETTVSTLLGTGKAMGHVYQCWRRICRETNVFLRLHIMCFTIYIHQWLICPDWFWGPPNLLSNGYEGLFSQGVKRRGREADHSPQTSAEVKKMWIYTSTPPILFRGIVLN
jgi:hypothetical protein